MTDILENLGFKKTGTCRCQGYYTEKFGLSNYRVEVRPKKYVAKIKNNSESITDWVPFKEAEQKLKELNVAV